MLRQIRRVVTGHDQNGRSVILSDSASPHTLALLDSPAYGLTDLWVTGETPADNQKNMDANGHKVVLCPSKNGSIFRVVEFPPEKDVPKDIDRKAAFTAMGASHNLASEGSRHPFMHKTATIDYAIILSGEIYAILDEGETLLHAGDCLVQRGTNHSWSNRGNEPCLVAFILIDAQPIDK